MEWMSTRRMSRIRGRNFSFLSVKPKSLKLAAKKKLLEFSCFDRKKEDFVVRIINRVKKFRAEKGRFSCCDRDEICNDDRKRESFPMISTILRHSSHLEREGEKKAGSNLHKIWTLLVLIAKKIVITSRTCSDNFSIYFPLSIPRLL